MNQTTRKSFKPQIGLDTIRLLGENLYSNVYFALSELIANSHDANAENVYVDVKKDSILIKDDGVGMSDDDLEPDYLKFGKSTRNDERKMGRKGIGKLASLFVADVVHLYSRKKDSDKLTTLELTLDKKIIEQNDDPESFYAIAEEEINLEIVKWLESKGHGTVIEMKGPLKSSVDRVRVGYELKNKFDMFSSLSIWIEDEKLNFQQHTLPAAMVYLVTFGDERLANIPDEYLNRKTPTNYKHLVPPSFGDKYKDSIHGWAVVLETINKNALKAAGITNRTDINRIQVFSRGKLGQENILPKINNAELGASYISGYINAKVFEEGDNDMALSNREGYSEADERFSKCIEFMKGHVISHLIREREKFADKKKEIDKEDKKEHLTEEAKGILKIFSAENNSSQEKAVLGILEKIRGIKVPERMLLVSHSSKDLLFPVLIANVIQKLGFYGYYETEKLDPDAKMSVKTAVISSINEYSHERDCDFWDWIYKNCFKGTSVQRARTIFVWNEHASKSFNVGVEAGMFQFAAEKKKRFVFPIDETDVNPLLKYSPSQDLPILAKSWREGKGTFERDVATIFQHLMQTYAESDSPAPTIEEIEKIIEEILNRDYNEEKIIGFKKIVSKYKQDEFKTLRDVFKRYFSV